MSQGGKMTALIAAVIIKTTKLTTDMVTASRMEQLYCAVN